ncbi:hypothetical protein PGT21_006809 [Puccinia graminis f. sp. tritici]|uniref:Uncharacterized protein n=1 Tax=Puccinia graminis f. sp. tritici TaxID=56615 RepID=A0A5B0S6Q3_PUCGR|nr:hypothetical protein PGT21_006809 [Puccinia graminis f. sp. tritici]KAA1132284.1 hypothetical protein PGTUg99_003323 [Puccinia graminis f. sp. tritici]
MANSEGDSEGRPMSRLISRFSSLGEANAEIQIRYHENLVARELSRVNNVYVTLWDGIVNRPDPMVLFNQVECRTELIEELRTKRFYTLRRQVFALSKTLITPANSQITPVSKLKEILKIISKLDATLGKIKFAIACINPDLNVLEVRHDHDYKNAKKALCCRLGLMTYETTGYVCELLRTSCRFIEDLGHNFAVDAPRKKNEVLTIASNFSDAIDMTLNFMDLSELKIFQHAWRSHIDSMDDALQTFLKFVNRPAPDSAPQLEAHLVNEDANARPERAPPISNQPHTIISVIAIIKLSRLFFAKLLEMTSDQTNFSTVTDLTSRELDIFAGMTVEVSESIEKLVKAVCGELEEDPIENILATHDSITHLQSAPKTILSAINHVFPPVFHQGNQPSRKIYYKAWFYRWNNLHQLATRNFNKAFRFNAS